MKNKGILLFCMLMSGCNSSSSDEGVAQREWNEKNIQSYSFEYQETGFTPASGDVWEIQVVDGEVIYVNYMGTGNPETVLNVEQAPTIDELFTRIADCEDKSTCEVTLFEYDKVHFYPTKYNESYGSEGTGFEVFNFKVQ